MHIHIYVVMCGDRLKTEADRVHQEKIYISSGHISVLSVSVCLYVSIFERDGENTKPQNKLVLPNGDVRFVISVWMGTVSYSFVVWAA
jgi:hypothetical protein